MKHWEDPHRRGVYLGMAHQPPYPQPPQNNDLPNRVARLEAHQWHETQDRRRIETESLQRGVDVVAKITAMDTRIQSIERHIGVISSLSRWLPAILKYSLAVFLFGLVMSGKLSLETVIVLRKLFAG